MDNFGWLVKVRYFNKQLEVKSIDDWDVIQWERERFGDGTLNPLQQFSRAIKQSLEWLFLSGGCSMLKHNKTFQMAPENIWDWRNVDFYCYIIFDRCLKWNSKSLLCRGKFKRLSFLANGTKLDHHSTYISPS